MNRTIYRNIRKGVRENILYNSNIVHKKNCLFLNGEPTVLMGGIIYRVEKQVGLLQNMGLASVTKYIPLEEYEQAKQQWIIEDSEGFEYKAHSVSIELEIFDFSGIFTVHYDAISEEKKANTMRTKYFSLKSGDIIYVLGMVLTETTPEGNPLILAESLFDEEELLLYKNICEEQFTRYKKERKSIDKRVGKEDFSQVFYYELSYNPINALRLILNKDLRIKERDYFYLCQIIGKYCERYPSLKLAQLLLKYYCKDRYCTIKELAKDEVEQQFIFSLWPVLGKYNDDGELLSFMS